MAVYLLVGGKADGQRVHHRDYPPPEILYVHQPFPIPGIVTQQETINFSVVKERLEYKRYCFKHPDGRVWFVYVTQEDWDSILERLIGSYQGIASRE